MSSKTGLSPEVRDGGGDRSGDGDVEVGGEGGDGVVRVASWLVMHHYPQHCVTCVLTVLTLGDEIKEYSNDLYTFLTPHAEVLL